MHQQIAPEIAVTPDGAVFMRMRPPVSPEEMVDNMRSSLSRGLREVREFKGHGDTLAVASGGPSLQDTWPDLEGHVAAVNGSLGFLLDKGLVPHFCGVCDATPKMADIVVADPRVRYLVASNCSPRLFDKLLAAGCKVWLWHSTGKSLGTMEAEEVLRRERPETWLQIFGGCSMGLRWINLGYALGYRRFHLHGLDSSFRDDKTHAYPDARDGEWARESSIEVEGYRTSINFLQQVQDFGMLLDRMRHADTEPVVFKVFGDGLLQQCYRRGDIGATETLGARNARLRTEAVLRRLPAGPVVGAEVGVFAGAMSSRLLRRPGLLLHMIDSWEGNGAAYAENGDWHTALTQPQQDAFRRAAIDATAFAAPRRRIVAMRSEDAAPLFDDGSLNFVFIDADHSREGCANDIALWRGKVRPGGWLCGHDYGNPVFPGVREAVDAAFGDSIETDADSTWFVRMAQ